MAKNQMHPETKAMLELLPFFKDNLEHGGTNASILAKEHHWSYDRFLHWLGKWEVIDFVTGRFYGESMKEFELRKQREKILVESTADEAIMKRIQRLESTINQMGLEVQKLRREVKTLRDENERLKARLAQYENGTL